MTYQSPGSAKTLFPLLGIAALLGLFLLVVLVSRGRHGQGAKGLPCVETAEQQEKGESQIQSKLTVQVGIDGSESMLGFVKGGTSQYITVIQKLDDLLRPNNLKADFNPNVKDVNVNHFRLGISKSNQIKRRQHLGVNDTSFLDAKFPRFYCFGKPKEYPCVSSSLHQIFVDQAAESASDSTTVPSNLSSKPRQQAPKESQSPGAGNDTMQILITDLEPDNAASGEITDQISNIFDRHPDYKAILLGIPSEFNGILYSADRPDSITKHYQSGGNEKQKNRPFYLFVIGPSSVVQTFVERFLDRIGKDMAKTIRASAFQRQPSPIKLDISTTLGENDDDCTYRRFDLNGKKLTPEQESDWLILEQKKCPQEYKKVMLSEVHSSPSWLLRGGDYSKDLFVSSEPSVVKVNKATLNEKLDQPFLNLEISIGGKNSSSDEQPVFISLREKDLDEMIWKEWNTPLNKLEGPKTQLLMDFVKSVRGKVSKGNDALRFCLGYIKT